MNLIFQDLELFNFKSFAGKHSFPLQRDPGLYYITGKNKLAPQMGANGAGKSTILDALLWVLTGKTGRDARPANSVVPWSNPTKRTRVTVFFKKGGKEYSLTRTRKPNDLILTSGLNNDRKVEQGEVDALIGLSDDMLRWTIILGQFGSLFLDLKPEQQSQIFKGMNIELWMDAAKAASESKRAEGGRLDGLQIKASGFAGRLIELADSLGAAQEAADLWASQAEERKGELIAAEIGFQAKAWALIPRPTEGKAGKGGKSGQKGGQGWPSGDLLADALASGERALASLERTFRQFERDRDALDRAVADLDRQVERYGDAKTCPECGQKVGGDHLKLKRKELVTQATEAHELLALSSKQVDTNSDLVKEARIRVDDLRGALHEFKVLKSRGDGIRDQIEALKADNPHKETIKDLKARLKVGLEKKAAVDADVKEAEELIQRYAYWIDAFKEIRLQMIDKVLLELEMTVTRHAESLGLEGWGIKFQTEKVLASGGVSTAFTILLYPPSQDRRAGDSALFENEAIRWASYSGGEVQRWQLAVAFALSEIILARSGVMPNIEFYDEPTRGMGAEGIANLLDCLADRAAELKRAIYVVEHHSLERGLFAGTIQIIKDEEGSYIKE